MDQFGDYVGRREPSSALILIELFLIGVKYQLTGIKWLFIGLIHMLKNVLFVL